MCFCLGCGCPYPCWELTSNSRRLKLEIQMRGSHSTVHRPGTLCCSSDTSLPLHPRSLLLAGWWLVFVPKHRLLFYKLLESRAFFFFFSFTLCGFSARTRAGSPWSAVYGVWSWQSPLTWHTKGYCARRPQLWGHSGCWEVAGRWRGLEINPQW